MLLSRCVVLLCVIFEKDENFSVEQSDDAPYTLPPPPHLIPRKSALSASLVQTEAPIQKDPKKFSLEKKAKNEIVMCPTRQQPNPQTLPLLTTPQCTGGWFAKTEMFVLKN